MIRYKVVKIIEGRRYSAVVQGVCRTEYPPHSEVRARRGLLGLMVFETLSKARDFIRVIKQSNPDDKFQILPVKTRGGRKAVSISGFIDEERIAQFYLSSPKMRELMGILLPSSGLLVRRLRCLE